MKLGAVAMALSLTAAGVAWGRGFGGFHGGMGGGGMRMGGFGGGMGGGMPRMGPSNFGGMRPGGNFGGMSAMGNLGGGRSGFNFGGTGFGGFNPGSGLSGVGTFGNRGLGGSRFPGSGSGGFGGAAQGLGAAGGFGAGRLEVRPDRDQLGRFLGMPSDDGFRAVAGANRHGLDQLGIFAMTNDQQTKANLILQLAVNKQGVIRGNYTATLTNDNKVVQGSVDKKTQRAAWTIGDNKENVMETGIYNLTKDEAPMLVHFGSDRTEQWLLVRLHDDEAKK